MCIVASSTEKWILTGTAAFTFVTLTFERVDLNFAKISHNCTTGPGTETLGPELFLGRRVLKRRPQQTL